MEVPNYLYFNSKFNSDKLIIVLPEIFGLTTAIKETVDTFAQSFRLPVIGLDFFYEITGEITTLDYNKDVQLAVDLMNKFTGEDYLKIWEKMKTFMLKELPEINELWVFGFCFGGKLAYLSGFDKAVTKIISFYGGDSLAPFIENQNVIEYISNIRRQDETLKILGLFGEKDEMISAKDRERIDEIFHHNGIDFNLKIYDAGHGFFNSHRPGRYDEKSAKSSFEDVKEFLRDDLAQDHVENSTMANTE